MKICVIGAGSSGIAACKVLHENGLDFVCYEKGSGIGGNWRYNNDNGMSAAYKSLHINTSKYIMAYSDFPMPDDYPDYPNHEQILAYFEDYVDHFGFRSKIQFKTSVLDVRPHPEGGYQVTTDRGSLRFDAVLVCNGHHWSKRFPEFPGNFTGKTLHAHDYRTFHGFEDLRVLIVGIGNSATDLAVELTRVARSVTISTRSRAYIIPKYILGVPTDQFALPFLFKLPLPVQRFFSRVALTLAVGRQKNYGVPEPDRPLLTEHPTISQDLLFYAGHGKIAFKPNIQRLDGLRVFFEDGSSEEYDALIYCTGYNIVFPFFDEKLLSVKNNDIRLYKRVVHPDFPNLFFIGLVQPLGAVMPLAERQSEWAAAHLMGKLMLPSRNTMLKSIEKDRQALEKRYNASPRHTIQVDFWPYKWDLEKELRRAGYMYGGLKKGQRSSQPA
ncbi:MAG: NAD(P)-binding domain-containing protein [Flavobacteriales bacterium]|nr:NAD(P)-binding domain-containing protein [Flavobacteriales bacterium]MDW8432027.1 NAD(P)-binding domain-containing protein [Flavobacteriales bacterium]